MLLMEKGKSIDGVERNEMGKGNQNIMKIYSMQYCKRTPPAIRDGFDVLNFDFLRQMK